MGVMYTAPTKEIELKCEMAILDLELKTGYNFSSEFFDEYYAKDVNNYFTVIKDAVTGERKINSTKGALFNKKLYGNNQIVGHFIMDYLMGNAKSLMDYMAENPNWFLCRAKVNRQFTLIRANQMAFPVYSEKTGRMLKKPSYMFFDEEEIGQQVRGYPTVNPEAKFVRKITHKTGKIGLVARIADKLSDEIPTREDLDYQYFIDLVLTDLAKIKPIDAMEKAEIVSVMTGK